MHESEKCGRRKGAGCGKGGIILGLFFSLFCIFSQSRLEIVRIGPALRSPVAAKFSISEASINIGTALKRETIRTLHD
jgi:hypothetical protein